MKIRNGESVEVTFILLVIATAEELGIAVIAYSCVSLRGLSSGHSLTRRIARLVEGF